MIKCSSTVKLNMPMIRKLERSQIMALEQTAENLHTEVVQKQVMPFDTGNLQNESTFVDCSYSEDGSVSLISSTPYARRLYFHPEYHFQKHENPHAKGEWYKDYVHGGRYEEFAQKTYEKIYRRIAGL